MEYRQQVYDELLTLVAPNSASEIFSHWRLCLVIENHQW